MPVMRVRFPSPAPSLQRNDLRKYTLKSYNKGYNNLVLVRVVRQRDFRHPFQYRLQSIHHFLSTITG
jgi:hypothetical protein